MARLPLTVYLPRADLARLETRARSLGMARSAFAGTAIKALLDGHEGHELALVEHLQFLRAATEELIGAHPAADTIRERLAARLALSPPLQTDGNAP